MPSDFWGGMNFIIETYWPLLLAGARLTLFVSLIGTIVGCFVGLIVAVLRLLPVDKNTNLVKKYSLSFMKFILGFYVEFIRGTPMMVQALFIYYGGRTIGMQWTAIQASLFIVSLNTGAYAAEIMRGGIISVDSGQNEGARAIGMSHFQAMIYVIIPQALRNSLPSIGNEFIINIKDTSVLNVITLNELFLQARTISGAHYRSTETYLVVAILYFVMTYSISRILKLIENKYDQAPKPIAIGGHEDE